MSGPDDSRRAFLTGGTVVAASAAFVADAPAQSKMVINDPNIVREIEAEFAGYDRALGSNDVAALNGFFFESPVTIRYGNAENLYGYSEIQAYRGSVVASGVGPRRERTVITTYGSDFATVSTLPGARSRARLAGRCKPGCDFHKAGASSLRTSALSTTPRSRNGCWIIVNADDVGVSRYVCEPELCSGATA
jgi:Protein of unknown function (DUF3225)